MLLAPKRAADITTDTATLFQYFPFIPNILSVSRGESRTQGCFARSIPLEKAANYNDFGAFVEPFDSAVRPYRILIYFSRISS